MTIIELYPFSEIIYYDAKTRDRIEYIRERAEALIHEIELRLIRDGVRKCDFIHIDPQRPDLSLVYKYGLVHRGLQLVRKYSGFAHKHYEPRSLDEALLFTAVCIDDSSLDEVEYAYRNADHRTIGKLLGYPECDTEFFTKWWGRHLDLVYPTAMGSERDGDTVLFDPRLNIMLRYIGIRLVMFFPHSFQCGKAIEFANKVYERVAGADKSLAKEILDILSKPLIFSQVNGVIQVDVFDNERFKEPILTIVQAGYSDDEYKIKMIPRYVEGAR